MSNSLKHTFVTSDHHFGSWQNFDFLKVFSKEQEKELIAKWNSVVGKDDIVYYNGDFCDCNFLEMREYFKQLNGHIILVRGNHDQFSDGIYKAVFDDVVDYVVLDDLGIVINHCPKDVDGAKEVYGHVHREGEEALKKHKGFCSCVQFNDGYPVSLEKIVLALR